jgi:hypothetical protein
LRGEIRQKREDQHSTLTARDKAEERNNGVGDLAWFLGTVRIWFALTNFYRRAEMLDLKIAFLAAVLLNDHPLNHSYFLVVVSLRQLSLKFSGAAVSMQLFLPSWK